MSNQSDIIQSSGATSIVETNQAPPNQKQSPFIRHMYKNSVHVQSNSSGVLQDTTYSSQAKLQTVTLYK